ncbi:carboxymuconolactone decarboxylase family protein [Kribbella sandramycini]|uniref:AhpD family alkylhydroperoxidase n=1 Tax=Kribbella sandramycini TaxID=60450 RepID=A0A7Y4KVK5_9ACTN|nr:carboxymuconolactone decarboxylase family protein [Kribbella sandramycini]MBB6567948.1 AhpD family alkylhydroperoxidase [Kribbella sandramycini]NOL39457.1 carboxymuconolactone decarboxylase family protein [Kribbella sandramycini]
MEQRIDMTKAMPGGVKAVYGIEGYLQGVLDHTLLHLIKVRASLINGCGFCIDMHTKDALKEGETTQRLFGLAAWREVSFYDDRERAALDLTDVVTELGPHGVPDDVWNAAVQQFGEEGTMNVLLAIGTINLWNRLAISTRTQPPVTA